MIWYIIRRVFNYAVLTLVATSLAYMLASIGLNPEKRFLQRNPPVPQEVIESTLNRSVSLDATLVVQPVSVESFDLVAALIVGLALAVMVSATVGG